MITRPKQSGRLGQRLGSLRLERLVGEGGMGSVYEARCLREYRSFAVKILHPELVRDPLIYARFHREARIASSLKSEHIVSVRDFTKTEDGTPYLVMDLLQGRDLRRILASEAPLTATRAIDLISQACRGLRVAHEHQPAIIHRDLKPENLFVCCNELDKELLKILDFGIAKVLWSVDSTTRTGSVLGTPHYMSPEQAEGVTTLDQRTDIYSLGGILYEALSGHKAHPGATYNQVISHILLKSPTPLDKIRTDLSNDLVGIVQRAMAVDPAARYQTVAEFEEALASVRLAAVSAVRGIAVTRPAEPQQDLETVTLRPEPESDSLPQHRVAQHWVRPALPLRRELAARSINQQVTFSGADALRYKGRLRLVAGIVLSSFVLSVSLKHEANNTLTGTVPAAIGTSFGQVRRDLAARPQKSSAKVVEGNAEANVCDDAARNAIADQLLVIKPT
ncbi:MAG: serine/threonine-protein kinase, partial [Myxococcales bacterium]